MSMRVSLLAFLAGILLPVHSPAQVTTATFYGIVADSSGARVPGALVSFTHQGTR